MTDLHASVVGWGHFVPERVVTNDELSQLVDTTDEWIRSRSGIRERHFADESQATSDLCVEAANRAIACAGISPDEIDLVLVATSSPDFLTPPTSSQVQHRVGATRAGAMTLMVGCTGFVYGLVTAEQFIRTGAYRTILLVGAEVISKNLDMTDRNTCVLFGDGAGAVVLRASHEPCGVLGFELGSDGSAFEAIISPSPGTREPVSQASVDGRRHYLRMDGRAVFRFATRTMVESVERVLDGAGLTTADVDLLIPHQANARIIEYAAEQLGFPAEKVVTNVERFGNTSAASIPIALSEALTDGRAKAGDTLALVGFGAGLTWAATAFRLGSLAVREDAAETRARDGDTAPVSGDGGIVEGYVA